MENDPFALVEGMAIAAFATGCDKGFVFVRAEYPLARQRIGCLVAVETAFQGIGNADVGIDAIAHGRRAPRQSAPEFSVATDDGEVDEARAIVGVAIEADVVSADIEVLHAFQCSQKFLPREVFARASQRFDDDLAGDETFQAAERELPAAVLFHFRLIFALCRAVLKQNRVTARDALSDFITSHVSILLNIAFLAHQTLVSLDAIVRTIIRSTRTT